MNKQDKEIVTGHVNVKTDLGETQSVPVSVELNEDSWFKPIQQVTFISDGVELKDVWIATFEKTKLGHNMNADELEWVKEKVFQEEPTDEELMIVMSQLGFDIYDICYVTKAKQFTYKEED